MSYIIKHNDPFISVKLTEKGREQLSRGRLTYSKWAIGDSEVNYNREEVVDDNPTHPVLSATSRVIRPKEQNPDLRYFITDNVNENPLNDLTEANLSSKKLIINNEAKERGFFERNGSIFDTKLTDEFVTYTGSVVSSQFNGGDTLDIGSGATFNTNDLILFKYTTEELGSIGYSNQEPTPHLWYQIESANTTTITVDRELPNLTDTGTSVNFIIYPSGEVHNTFGTGTTTAYWDAATLTFDSSCDISCDDVPVWNMNNVWCENPAGLTGAPYEDHIRFGSYDYLGTKHPYLGYDCDIFSADTQIICEGESQPDGTSKSLSLIHYTNNVISNFYGEHLYIDNDEGKTTKLHVPDIMYHRRGFDTESGDTMGMTFVASGDPKTIANSDIEYVDLIEEPSLVDDEPEIVGKVFPQLKMVAFDDDEIVAANSYKSNRNWTLPELSAELVKPTGGTGTGVLPKKEVMYLSYIIENETGTGFTTSMNCQNYVKITNRTSTSKDISFTIDELGLLPYMRKIEKSTYDGRGFYGYRFKLVYQIVSDPDDRPDPDAWKEADFTSDNITGVSGETIDPVKLERQDASLNGFILNTAKDNNATTFNIIDKLGLPLNINGEELQFGDERFFYGNVETWIGATVYKTILRFNVDPSRFDETTNPTRGAGNNEPDIRVTEVGVYDDENNLVMIGKLSKPVILDTDNIVSLELTMDF